MSEMAEGLDKKSFFMVASYAAENATDDIMVGHFADTIRKYEKAKKENASKERLSEIYKEIAILSYVVILRTLDRTAEDLIKNMEDIDRVLDLITPPTN